MILKEKISDLAAQAKEIVSICQTSLGRRTAAYRQYAQWVESGRASGGLALANMLYAHKDRLQSHLFSPAELRFDMDFENHYPQSILEQGQMVARTMTREWERHDVDQEFARGVGEALTYGACIPKLVAMISDSGAVDDAGESIKSVGFRSRLVMPWQFAVYDEGINELQHQEAVVETVFPNKHEVWRRIRALPDAEKLFARILGHSQKGAGSQYPSSFMHQVLSTAVLNPSLQNNTNPKPGGIVQLTNDPNHATLAPETAAEQIAMHEIYVKDDARGEDWTTIQLIEPDIIVAPRMKRENLFCAHSLPYGLIQPNVVSNYFWGRSEIVDLMMLQSALTEALDDTSRLTALQVDRILAFINADGITDETYGQFRATGYFPVGVGGDVKDVTPQFPAELLNYIRLVLDLMDRVSGFGNILSGQGESGVRAGSHANTLMKTASPRLRDRSLIVERQCAQLADQALDYLAAKDARAYYTALAEDGSADKKTEFLLENLPDDRRLVVDSHSSSPIYENDHQNLVAFGVKAGLVDPESAIEMLPFPRKDTLKHRLKEKQKQQAELIQQHPELLTKGKGHGR